MKLYINLIILQEYIFILVGVNFKLKIEDVWYEILHEFNHSTRINFYFGRIKFQVKNWGRLKWNLTKDYEKTKFLLQVALFSH